MGTVDTALGQPYEPPDSGGHIPKPPENGSGRRRLSRRLLITLVVLAGIATTQAALTGSKAAPRGQGFDERRYQLWADNLYYRGFYGDSATSPLAREEMRTVPYSAYVPPGYPFFLIALKAVHAGGPAGHRGAQAVMVGLIVLASTLLALRLFGPIAAVLTGVFLIATGVLATYAQYTFSEILAGATLVGSVVLATIGCNRRSWRLLLASGVLLGYSILVRPQVLLLPLPIAVFIFFSAGRKKAALVLAAIFLAGSYGVVAPWTIRNEARLHAFVPVTTYTWINFWEANNPQANGMFRLPEKWIGAAEVRRIRALPELQQDTAWRRMALAWVRQHPGKALVGWIRDARLFATGSDPYVTTVYAIHGASVPRFDERWLVAFCYLTIMLVLLFGRRNLQTMGIPIITILYFVAFFSLFIASARFRVPVLPLMVVFAAGLPELLATWIRQRRDPAPSSA